METLEDLIKELPPELKDEVRDFARFLLDKKGRTARRERRLRLTWAGALRDYRDRYTSLDLQKKALQWWGAGGGQIQI